VQLSKMQQPSSRKPMTARHKKPTNLTSLDVYTLQGEHIQVQVTRQHTIRHVNFVVADHVSAAHVPLPGGCLGSYHERVHSLPWWTMAALPCMS